jgi:MoaA/NifB/PqqE/SkfB family radical SAM enzyme
MGLTRKTVIITGYSCNNRCGFCIDANKKSLPQKSTQGIISEMIETRSRGRTYLEIIGGEQTIRPDFIYLIKMAKKIGFKDIVMATNGRMLSYRDYAKKLVEAGITSIIFSIHGHKPELHDFLTRVNGSFKQLLEGIRNIKMLDFKNIGSNTTIVKQNYKYLSEIGRFIQDLGIRNAEFIFVDPNSGGAHDNFKELVPRISEVAPYAKRCLDIGKSNGAHHWHIRYVPLCYFVGYEKQISELYEVSHFQTEHLAPDFRNFDVEGSRKRIARVKIFRCKDCIYYNYCEGIWKEYITHYGDEEPKPMKLEDIDPKIKYEPILKIEIEKINPYIQHSKEIDVPHLRMISAIKTKISQGKKIEPIIIERKNNSYDLVDGFCRYMTFKELGFKTIKCKVIQSEVYNKLKLTGQNADH